jgi:predicted nuclease with TOPRIM domain
MRIKKVVYLLSVLLLCVGFAHSVNAQSISSVSFDAIGVTIALTFPEEAHPADRILHAVEITANNSLTLKEFSMSINMWVNSSWHGIFTSDVYRNIFFQNNYTLYLPMSILLPPNANGTLQCFMHVRTQRQSGLDEVTYTFYTTCVSDLTFSELRNEYDGLLVNYSSLKADYEAIQIDYTQLATNYSRILVDYETLFGEYSDLLSNHSSLVTDYETLLDEHNGFLANYSSLLVTFEALQNKYDKLLANYSSNVAAHESLLTSYNALSNDRNSLNSKVAQYNELETEYNLLNSTRYNLQTTCDTLQDSYNELNQAHRSLAAEVRSLQEKINISGTEVNTSRILVFLFLIAVAGLVGAIGYLKKKKTEPYIVIRKETVAIKQDEKSET